MSTDRNLSSADNSRAYLSGGRIFLSLLVACLYYWSLVHIGVYIGIGAEASCILIKLVSDIVRTQFDTSYVFQFNILFLHHSWLQPFLASSV